MKSTLLKYLMLISLCSLVSCDGWLDITPKGKIIITTAEEYAQLFDNNIIATHKFGDVNYLNDEVWVNAQVIVGGWNSMNLTVANVLYKDDFDRSENAMGNGGLAKTFFHESYECITKIANTIIYNANDMKGTQEEIKTVVAQARLFRAFIYFQLINVYAKPYNSATAATDGGVPLRTDPFIETLPEPAKSTVAQIYAQIEKDIEAGLNDLPEVAVTPFRFNKAAGYALKAKVHLFKKEYDECITAASESYRLNNKTYDLVAMVNKTTNKPVPAIYATGDENLFFATTDATYFLIHPELITLFGDGLQSYGQAMDVADVRLNLYKQPGAAVKDYLFTRQYIPGRKDYTANSVGFRTTEVMLMLAECHARKGENDKVKEYLKPYFESRYENYNHVALTIPTNVVDAVKFVLRERRKELTMGFNRFMDLRRLNTESEYQTIPTRTIPGDPSVTPGVPQATYTLPVNSSLYVLPFPEKVIANDPRLISNTIQ